MKHAPEGSRTEEMMSAAGSRGGEEVLTNAAGWCECRHSRYKH